MSQIIARMILTLRSKGLLHTIAKAKKKITLYCVDETIVFLRYDLQKQPLPSSRKLSTTTFVTVEDPDDDNFSALCALFPDKPFLSRLMHDQHRCFIALTDGMVSAYGWVTNRDCRVDELKWTLPLNDDELYIYDCFVLPTYRRRGIYAAMLTELLREYGEYSGNKFYRYVCIGSALDNTGSMHAIRNIGFTEYFRIQYRRFSRKGKWLMTRIEPITEGLPDPQ